MHRCDSDQTSELQSQSRTISTENQAKNVQNPFYFNNTKDGTLLPQVILGGTGTHPKAGGTHEFNSFFKMFVAVGFAYSWWQSAVTDGGVNSAPHTSLFLMHSAHTELCASHYMAQECVCGRYPIPMVIHVVRLIVCSLSVPSFVPFRVSLLSLALLFPLLPEPWPEPLPPCGRRRGNYPLALRQMRSLAPWPNSHLAHEIISLLRKAGLEIVRGMYTLVRRVYNLSRQQCQWSRSLYRYKEIEEGESSNSLKTWAKRKGLNLLVRSADTIFGRQKSKPSSCTSLYAGRMRCKNGQRK